MPSESTRRDVPLDPQGRGSARPGADLSAEEVFAARHPQPRIATSDLEDSAGRVVGVYACRVDRAQGAALPDRVRVVVKASRRLAVAKDIQTAWFTVWNVYVPRGRFVVTPVRSPLDFQPRIRRLQLCEITLHHDGEKLAATTALFSGGRTYEGTAESPAEGADICRLAALATMEALREALPPEVQMELAGVRLVVIAGCRAVLCALAGRDRVLLGVCEVRGDERDAAARAVLDAANRLLGRVPRVAPGG